MLGEIVSGALSAGASLYNTKQQIKWERERAQNAHQWEVQDLKKAGLNPILSAGGSGAVTGPISPQMPDFSQIGQIGQHHSEKEQAKTAAKAQAAAEKLQNAEVGKAEAQEKLAKEQAAAAAMENATNAPRAAALKKYYASKPGQILTKIGAGTKDVLPAINAIGGGIVGAALFRGAKGAISAASAGKAAAAAKAATKAPHGRLYIPTEGGGRKYISGGPSQSNWFHNISTYERGQMIGPKYGPKY